MSGEVSTDITYQRDDELALVVGKGGFSLKGFPFSGKVPDKQLSSDNESINVAGSGSPNMINCSLILVS